MALTILWTTALGKAGISGQNKLLAAALGMAGLRDLKKQRQNVGSPKKIPGNPGGPMEPLGNSGNPWEPLGNSENP